MSEVRDVLREVRLTVGSEGDSGERERQQARVKRMLTAMGVAEEDLDNELRDHRQQQEAATAEADEAHEGQLDGVDTLVGAAGGIPREEGVGQDGHLDDVDMEVEGAVDTRGDKDVPCGCSHPLIAWRSCNTGHIVHAIGSTFALYICMRYNQHSPQICGCSCCSLSYSLQLRCVLQTLCVRCKCNSAAGHASTNRLSTQQPCAL